MNDQKVKWCEFHISTCICTLSPSMVSLNNLQCDLISLTQAFYFWWIHSSSVSHPKIGSPSCVNEWSWKYSNNSIEFCVKTGTLSSSMVALNNQPYDLISLTRVRGRWDGLDAINFYIPITLSCNFIAEIRRELCIHLSCRWHAMELFTCSIYSKHVYS